MPFQKMLKNWKKVGDEPAFRGFYKCCEKCGKLRSEKIKRLWNNFQSFQYAEDGT